MRKELQPLIASVSVCLAVVAFPQFATASIAIDASLADVEWSAATVENVEFNPGALTSNFGTPTNQNHLVAYDILTVGDANYFYVGIRALASTSVPVFANLYFDLTSPPGSDLGFEIFNNIAFIPSTGVNAPVTGILSAKTGGDGITPAVIEIAIPWSIFTTNNGVPGLTYAGATSQVQLRLSQSLGYSVAGGASYGDDRLGTLAVPGAVPEASSLVTFGVLALVATGGVLVRTRKFATNG